MMMQLSRCQQTKHMVGNNVSSFSAMPVHEGTKTLLMQHAYAVKLPRNAPGTIHRACAFRPHTTSTTNFAAAVNSLSTMPEGNPVAIDVALVCKANAGISFELDSETPGEVLGDISATGLPVLASGVPVLASNLPV